jgi:hypothetical protein
VSSEPEKLSGLVPRVHALLGLFGLGSFALVHLWAGLSVLWGREWFHKAYHVQEQRPTWFQWVLFAWVGVPLAVHASYGLWLLLGGLRPGRRGSEGASSAVRLRRQRIQAATGGIVLVFLLWHLSGLSFPNGLLAGAATDTYDRLVEQLSSTGLFGIPVSAAVYTFGSLVTLAHAGHGAWSSELLRDLRVRFPKHFTPLIVVGCVLTFVPVWVGVLHFATGWP